MPSKEWSGIQRKPAWARILLEFAKNAGHVGTWGPGLNTTSSIHVKDVASAILTVLVALVEGRADTGADGLCMYSFCFILHLTETSTDFVGCNETRPSWLDVTSAMGNVCGVLCQCIRTRDWFTSSTSIEGGLFVNPKRDHTPTSLFNHSKIATVSVIQFRHSNDTWWWRF